MCYCFINVKTRHNRHASDITPFDDSGALPEVELQMQSRIH